jgi:hypothetical protein
LTAEATWNVSITTTAGGPTSVTALASAASSYPADLLSAFKTALDAAAIGTWTVTGSFGESGTGKVNITCNQATYTLTWTSTSLRDALGFTASVTETAGSQTGSNHCDGVWLPTCSMWSKFGASDAGNDLSDAIYNISPRGDVLMLYGQRRQENKVRWSHVTRARARITGESVTGESFQQWWRDCHLGELAWCSPGAKVRIIWDADVPGTYTEYRVVRGESLDPPQVQTGWVGLFPVELDLVKVPS